MEDISPNQIDRTSLAAGESPGARSGENETRGHLRGSGLLLGGRMLALGTNFLVQVLTVRYLVKSDYGAFAYALSVVSLGASVNLLGLHRAVSRLVPMYHERHDERSMLGTLVVALGAVVGLGLALVLLTLGLRGFLADSVLSDPRSVGLLLILIALCPLQALDSVFQGVVAALASPRAIFFRRHVLGPLLKLAAVLLVLLVQGDVYLLATGYLVAGVVGVAVYVLLIGRVLRDRGLLERIDWRSLRCPVREIFSFSLPLLTADVAVILKTTMAVVLLESFHSSTEVAEFRAVLPVAGLILVVLQSLKFLFTPVASRLLVRNDVAGLDHLFWQSALWITIVTFPVFALCFFLADPVTVLLFGSRYSSAGVILAVLALGNYFNAAMGLNTYMLQVHARVGFISFSNVVSTLAGLALNLMLIPSHGALGAAIATTGAVVIQNVLNHVGVWRRTHVVLLAWRRWMVYLTVVVAVMALSLVRVLLDPPVVATVILVVVASFALVRINRRSLNIADTFPELLRVPLLRGLVGSEAHR